MVKDTKQEDKFYRADKLLEEEIEKRLKVSNVTGSGWWVGPTSL